MVLVLHFFSSFFVTVDELEKNLVAEEDDISHLLLRLYGGKKVPIIVVLFKLVRVQVYTYMFQKFIVKLPSTREVILLNSFYKRDTFFVTSTRELYCLIPSTGGIHLFVTSTKEVILLGSFYKRRYYSWSFGRRYIAWFLLQEEVLFLGLSGKDILSCSFNRRCHRY